MATMDNELRFSLAQENEIPSGYSREEHDRIIAILRPFLIRNRNLTLENYYRYVNECGAGISEKDISYFVRTAELANAADLRKRRNKLRDDWLYENIPLYKYAVDFAGSKDFKIRLPEELKDNNVSGTFWASKKDNGSAVVNLDELSEYIARERGDQRRGSRASRSESPSVFNVRTSMKSSPEAAMISHHTPAHNRC